MCRSTSLPKCSFVCRLPYAGDNFVRYSGDAMDMAKQQCMFVCYIQNL